MGIGQMMLDEALVVFAMGSKVLHLQASVGLLHFPRSANLFGARTVVWTALDDSV
jgi:hypothetical protein